MISVLFIGAALGALVLGWRRRERERQQKRRVRRRRYYLI